jgi:predicted ribosome quality control (RQC) complex YloA/Tae2 family protein
VLGDFFILNAMIRNYFYLNRYSIEINDILSGTKISQVFSQEKGKLVIASNFDKKEYFIEFSVIPGQSFINLRERYSRAKKNTIDFFSNSVGEKIKSVKIADDDRIIKIECSRSEFFFTIRGKYTNLFYLGEDDNFKAFKNLDEDKLAEIKKEFYTKNFTTDFNVPDLSLASSANYLSDIKKKFPVIGAEIIKEVKARTNDEYQTELKNVLTEIKNTPSTLFIDEDSGEVNIGFESFRSMPSTKKEEFDNIISAQNYFFSKKQYLERKNRELKLITKHLDKELKKLSNKLNSLQGVIEKGSREDEYNKLGNLLLVNLNLLKSGTEEIEVEDIYENKKIKIKLNSKLSPKKNIDYWFDKSKADKIGFEKSVELMKKVKVNYEKLKKIEDDLVNIDSLKELYNIIKDLKIKRQGMKSEKEDIKIKFKHYVIDDKYHIYVGKDSKNNDLLTTRFAKQNDYWFHARSVSGSHVVLRIENTKEAIPKNVLKRTAALAAYHSKAKTAGVVPVAFTFKKYVVKKKGFPIGTVHLLKEDVLLVKPEIPKGCEFIMDE